MDKLLNPDVGLMIWTFATFILLVVVLGKFAWRPILQSLEAREGRIRADVQAAEDARRAAEALKADYDNQLAQMEIRAREILAKTQKDAEALKDSLLKTGQEEAERLMEKTRKQLAEEQRQLIAQMRQEMAALTVRATEKVLRKTADKKLQETAVEEALAEFDKVARR